MSVSMQARVVADLVAQLRALVDDFAQWRERADLAEYRKPLGRIVDLLTGALDPKDLAQRFETAEIDDVEGLRRRIEIVHLIWNFFRDKLMQRDTKRYTAHLAAADDLAWACYLPFATARVEILEQQPESIDFTNVAQLRERALVFYTTDRSPFAQPRALSFYAPGLSSEDARLFAGALERLPVPLIGICWPQTLRVAPLVFVAHEVGHVVAQDLGIIAEVEKRIAAQVAEERRAVWLAWLDELVADVFGTLMLGPCYVDQLQRAVAGNRSDVRGEAIRADAPGKYPTRALRVALCQRVLATLGLSVDPLWEDTYGRPDNDAGPYAQDVEAVVDATLGAPYVALGRTLPATLRWSPDNEAAAEAVARAWIEKRPPRGPVRVATCVAAAAYAHRIDPAAFAAQRLDDVALEWIDLARGKAPVSTSDPLRERLQQAFESSGLESTGPAPGQADAAAGRALARFLKF